MLEQAQLAEHLGDPKEPATKDAFRKLAEANPDKYVPLRSSALFNCDVGCADARVRGACVGCRSAGRVGNVGRCVFAAMCLDRRSPPGVSGVCWLSSPPGVGVSAARVCWCVGGGGACVLVRQAGRVGRSGRSDREGRIGRIGHIPISLFFCV